MQATIRNSCFIAAIVVALMLNVTFADDTVPAKFVIVAPKAGMNSELGTSLFRVLRFGSQRGILGTRHHEFRLQSGSQLQAEDHS